MINKKYLNLYLKEIKKNINLKKPLKVLFDASDGCIGPILKKLLPKINNLNFILINSKPNGNFPHHGPDPNQKKALLKLKKITLKYKTDLTIAFDNDGDRVVFINHLGEKIEPALIIYLLKSNFKIKNKKEPKIVTDIIIYESLKYQNLLTKKIFLSQTGTYFIKEKMRKIKAELGAEQSGHFYFKNLNYQDDGLYAAIQFLNFISKTPFNLDQYKNLLNFKLKILNFYLPLNYQKKIIKNINQKYKKIIKKIINFDDLTFELQNGFLNIRKSNTESKLKISFGLIKT